MASSSTSNTGTFGDRFVAAITAIDAANAADPNTLHVGGISRPKELAHAEMLTARVNQLRPEASEQLFLAARAHHIRRWAHPRSSFQTGRNGYLLWRKEQREFHANETRTILLAVGYDEEIADRVSEIIQKRGLGQDEEVQAFEDGLCLVFLETQFDDLSARTERSKMVEIACKTFRKMSPKGLKAAGTVKLSEGSSSIVQEALERTSD
jgi:hypothetical protein